MEAYFVANGHSKIGTPFGHKGRTSLCLLFYKVIAGDLYLTSCYISEPYDEMKDKGSPGSDTFMNDQKGQFKPIDPCKCAFIEVGVVKKM